MDTATMDPAARDQLREFVRQALADAGDPAAGQALDARLSLFASGRLDSLAMTRLVLFLEDAFEVDFSEVDFTVDLVDSLEAIEALARTGRRLAAPRVQAG